MIYIDTDVLVNFHLPQNSEKHEEANRIYREVSMKSKLFVSLLCLQETTFVLRKLGESADDIDALSKTLFPLDPVGYDVIHFKRAIELACQVGFQHINDCLHTAIAEAYCEEPYTYNKADFKRIQQYTGLKITIF